MDHTVLFQAALALAAGMAVQVVAARIAVPAILLLLLAGIALGPDGMGFVVPKSFGRAREDLVSLAVIVILFEGALGLSLRRLRSEQRSLLLLLTLGGAISFLAGTLAAHLLLGLDLEIASLYGALMIVTGPTVVTPLLARIRVDRRVKELLIGEGVLIDPLGAIVALVAAEWVVGRHALTEAGPLVLLRLGLGAAVGAGAGAIMALLLRRRMIGEDLIAPAVLASAIVTATGANALSREAGLMAAVMQGIVLANAGVPAIGRLRDFKERVTVLLLSFLFVLLAADLPLVGLKELGWPALGVVAAVVYVARPISVALCTSRSGLSIRERAFVAWICPRGIVAAGVAGLFRLLLDEAGVPGGEALQALVFLTVGATVAVQGLSAGFVARALGLDFPRLRETLVVGADELGRFVAKLLREAGRDARLIDRSPLFAAAARSEGLLIHEGDALSTNDLELAGAGYADTLLAITKNSELNALVAQRVRESFHVERILAFVEGSGVLDERTARPFPGDFPGPAAAGDALRAGRLRLREWEVGDALAGARLGDVSFGAGSFAVLVQRGDATVLASDDAALARGDRLVCLAPSQAEATFAPTLRAKGTAPAGKAAAAADLATPHPAALDSRSGDETREEAGPGSRKA